MKIVTGVLFLIVLGISNAWANHPQIPNNDSVPPNGSQQWHPTWDMTAKWIMTKTIINSAAVELNCPDNGYACALPGKPNSIGGGGRCTIYMPEYDGYPEKKPPESWTWVLGKEQEHCIVGLYHD